MLHRAFYRNHLECGAVAHLHSPYAVAVSCLPELNSGDALPPLTPYRVMRVGRLALVEYAMPGSPALEQSVATAAAESRSVLLRNHGSIAAAPTLEGALDAVEEIEATARLYLQLQGHSPPFLPPEAVAELHERSALP